MAQVEQRLGAAECVLRRGEALRDDGREVMVDDVLLGVHHVGEALHAEGLGGGRRHEQDVGHGRHRVGHLDVEGDFKRP